MSILKFLSQEELDGLSEDEEKAFMELVNFAQRALDKRHAELGIRDEDTWQLHDEIDRDFLNAVSAAAKQFDIEPISAIDIPRHGSNNWSSEYAQFQSDLSHYVNQLILMNSRRNRSNTVMVADTSKDRIKSHLNELEGCIEKSSLDSGKKKKLLDRIASFRKELDRERLKLDQVMLWSLAILGAPTDAWESAGVVRKLVGNITEVVAKERENEEEQKLLYSASKVRRLSAPRAEKTHWNDDDTLDEVPF